MTVEEKVKSYPKWVVNLAKFYLPKYPSDMQIVAYVEQNKWLIDGLFTKKNQVNK